MVQHQHLTMKATHVYLTNSSECFLATAACLLEEIVCRECTVDISWYHLLVRRVLRRQKDIMLTTVLPEAVKLFNLFYYENHRQKSKK